MALLLRLAIIAACTLAGAAWLVHKGPVPVVRITTPVAEMAPFWYMVLAFPVLGMLVADLVDLYRSRGIDRLSIELAVQIALIVAISNLRLGIRIPLSGHALLAAYFIARRWWLRPYHPQQSTLEVPTAVVIFCFIAYPKLVWWNDPVTLCTGLAAGLFLAKISQWITASHLRTEPR
jgi:hypothetical protein